MKSYNHLYEKLIDLDNIVTAIYNASKRKKRRHEVQAVIDNPWHHAHNIVAIVERGEFTPQKHHLRRIQDTSSGKERYIMKPYFYHNRQGEEVYEQVIQHAVVQVLKPIIMKGMYCHSYGSIPGRGCHSGMRALAGYIRNNKDTNKLKYAVKCDIHHFYQSINKELIKQLLAKKIHDTRFLNVVYTILDSNIGILDHKEIDMGLPIGFYSSQWLANFLLQDFDHFIKEKMGAEFYIRYMDDFIIFGSNKKKLREILYAAKAYLENLDLSLKGNYQLFRFDYKKKDGKVIGRPLDFMGFKFYRDRVTLRKTILRRARKAAMNVHNAVLNNKLNWYLCSRIISYKGWFKSTNTKKYVAKYIRPYVHEFLCKRELQRHGELLHWLAAKRERRRKQKLLMEIEEK